MKAIIAALLLIPSAASASDVPKISYADLAALPVPVTAGDVDRPYTVVGKIKDQIRRGALVNTGELTEDKARQEIWERGQKMGADAVIHAEIGELKKSIVSVGNRAIKGDAIKFTD